jgi:hypothetical protein
MAVSLFNLKGSLTNNVPYYLQIGKNGTSSIDFSGEFVTWDTDLIPTMRYDQVLKFSELFKTKASNITITLGLVNPPPNDQNFNASDLEAYLCRDTDSNCSSLITIFFSKTPDYVYSRYSDNNNLFKGQVIFQNNNENFGYYLTVNVQFNFQVTISCDQNSNNIFCNNFCSCVNSKTCNNCYQTYTTNCFNSTTSFNQNCFNFFQNYMNLIGPNGQLDQLFHNYCSTKYKTIQDAIQDPVCACHLDDKVYSDILRYLNKKFKNVDKVFDQNKTRCVLPQCASSNFPYSTIGKMKCQGVRCLNIVEVEGNNIDFSKITINQSGDCINLIGHQ